MSNLFPHHNQQSVPSNIGVPPEVPNLLAQSRRRLDLYRINAKALIDGVDMTITSVNNALKRLQANSPDSLKLSKYMQRCIDHKNRIISVLELAAKEELLVQQFYAIWIEGKEFAEMQVIVPQQQVAQQQVDSRLPIGPDGKPIGTVRADGAIDITGKKTSIPINGVLSPEQAKELGLVGQVGPTSPIPVINGGGTLTPEQQKAYIAAEEVKLNEPAVNIAGNAVASPALHLEGSPRMVRL